MAARKRDETKDSEATLASEATVAQDGESGASMYCTVMSDITERKRVEKLQALAATVLQILNETSYRENVIRDIILAVKESTGIEAIGIRLKEGKDYPYFETNGFPAQFIEKEGYLCARDGSGDVILDRDGNVNLECMCGNVICERTDSRLPFFTKRGSFWTNSTTELFTSTTEADLQTWTRNYCNTAGYKSVALIPLHSKDQIIGLFQFNDHRKGCFSLNMIEFFEGLGDSIGVAIDRKQAEEALRESEERYRRITDTVTDYIFTAYIENGQVVKTVHGPACIAVTGYSMEEFTADPYLWFTMVLPEDRDRVKNHASCILTDNAPVPIEHRIRRKDGEVRWVMNTPVPHRDSSGSLISYDGLIRDITERKRAEEALRNSEVRYRRLFETAKDGILDAETGRITDVNPFLTELLGFSQEQLLGKEIWDLGFLKDSIASQSNFLELQREKYIRYENLPLETADGRHVDVEFVSNVYLVDHKKVIQCNIRDITARKRAEAEREQLEVRLIQAQKMDSIGRLAGGVAHDFNNMLCIILGHAEMALMTLNPSDSLFKDIQEIMTAGQRSADLTRQLLTFARKQTVVPIVLDINDTIAGMLKMLKRLIGENIDLLFKPAVNLWPVKMDLTQIDQILANLTVNARDAITSVGKVTIETENTELDDIYSETNAKFISGRYVILTVSDDGCGMDKETQKQLFEPFFTTKPEGHGTGLGLATVYGIVKQNNGVINVVSEPGKGTTFKIYLPRYETGKAVTGQTRKPAEIQTGTETVLLAEDLESLLKISKRLLEQLGYNVLAAGSPNEAIHLAEQYEGDIHLLLTDVVIPEMSGRDLWGRLSALRPNMKSLFMSGYTADIIAHQGVLDEGIHFIQKPFSIMALSRKLRDALTG